MESFARDKRAEYMPSCLRFISDLTKTHTRNSLRRNIVTEEHYHYMTIWMMFESYLPCEKYTSAILGF